MRGLSRTTGTTNCTYNGTSLAIQCVRQTILEQRSIFRCFPPNAFRKADIQWDRTSLTILREHSTVDRRNNPNLCRHPAPPAQDLEYVSAYSACPQAAARATGKGSALVMSPDDGLAGMSQHFLYDRLQMCGTVFKHVSGHSGTLQ